MTLRILIFTILTLSLAGCATYQKFNSSLDGLIGQNIEKGVFMLGPPASIQPVSANMKAYNFVSNGPTMVTAQRTMWGANAQVQQTGCRVMLMVDNNEVIQAHRWQGHCPTD